MVETHRTEGDQDMRNTASQTSTRTLADLIRSWDRRQAVTITYAPAGEEETVRTIEVHDIRTTEDGHIVVIAMCRLRGAERQFRVQDIAAYTLHRIAFVLERPAPTTYERPATAPTHSETAILHFELERDRDDADYRPRRKLAQRDIDLAV